MTVRSIILAPVGRQPMHADYVMRGMAQALIASGLVSTVLGGYTVNAVDGRGYTHPRAFRFTVDTESVEAVDRVRRMVAAIVHAGTGDSAAGTVAWQVGEVE